MPGYLKIPQNKLFQVSLTSSILLTALILLYVLLGRPVFKYSDNLKAEFISTQEKLSESERLIRNFPNPQKEMGELEKKAQELRNMGASTKQLPRLIQSLAMPANNLNLNVSSIRPRDDLKADNENLPAGVTKIYVEVVMSCSYQTLAEYIKAVHELPTNFIIERLTIEKKEEDAGELDAETKKTPEKNQEKPIELSANLLLSTYMIWEI
ncbi:MAG: type 4a pilus biogenesis protein PilO [Candidatus Omnitrophota bacterium]|nr:type 4a pilus biogenesis protein PilO [Candidatus Omnitrophota bacterium]